MKRRNFLKTATLSGAALLPLGRSAMAAIGERNAGARRLVVVFLRGAVDGLSIVVPYADGDYYRARPDIALAPPGREGGALDLDGRFGLHPALAPLLPYWQAGRLAFVPASGSPDSSRSHFDAQDYMESATPGRKATPDGWLNRLLDVLPSQDMPNPLRAVSIGPVLPRIFAGRQSVANLPQGKAATRPTLLDRPRIADAFDRLYGGEDKLSQAYRESQQAHREAMAALDPANEDQEMLAANNGAPPPNGFPDDAARLARLMRREAGVQLAFMALGGWDTHANQGAVTGQLANRLQPLGQGLAALAEGLGPVLDETVIVVMSEFGRTVRQNGNGGTDHGHGNVMWLLGGDVAGGRLHGRWPGLDQSALYEGRDVAVTTDFRQVLATVCERHLGLADARLAEVFPGFREEGSIKSLIRR
jgi:uncharacterized protein (DUF1501 family)